MITIEPDVAPAKASSPNRRRLYLMLALMGVAGAVFIAFACVWHNAALYRYAHVPYRSCAGSTTIPADWSVGRRPRIFAKQ